MYPEQVNNNYEGDGVLLYGLQGTSFYKETKENKVVKQLIDKSDLTAEIEKRKSELQSRIAELGTFESNTLGLFQEVDLYDDIISFLNTLETKEVDLDKEIYNYLDIHNLNIQDGGRIVFNNGDTPNFIFDFRDIAKHFYELGLAQKVEE